MCSDASQSFWKSRSARCRICSSCSCVITKAWFAFTVTPPSFHPKSCAAADAMSRRCDVLVTGSSVSTESAVACSAAATVACASAVLVPKSSSLCVETSASAMGCKLDAQDALNVLFAYGTRIFPGNATLLFASRRSGMLLFGSRIAPTKYSPEGMSLGTETAKVKAP